MSLNFETAELPEGSLRQFIDSRQSFTALEEWTRRAQEFRGGMVWRQVKGNDYLIRTSITGGQKSLGRRSAETEAIYEKFTTGKARAAEMLGGLREAVARNERLNRALYVGRAPRVVVDVLAALQSAGVAEHFTAVGTNALFAYETAAGVRLTPSIMETRDFDLLWDNRKKLSLAVRSGPLADGMLALLRKVDPSFELRRDQLFTAINKQGYEVDIIRRLGPGSDLEPGQIAPGADDFWAVQARNSDWLLSAPKFSEVIVSENGRMARMSTVDPRAFALFKLWMASDKDRDPLKKSRDQLQAEAVIELVRQRMPQLSFDDIKPFPQVLRKQATKPAPPRRRTPAR